MWTAGSHFHHFVREQREKKHRLVTSGIYSILRHPAYFGWFYWSVGTQVLLSNPLGLLAYAYVSWRFFYNRIPFEEATLVRFFGADYVAYRQRTSIGIPGIAAEADAGVQLLLKREPHLVHPTATPPSATPPALAAEEKKA